ILDQVALVLADLMLFLFALLIEMLSGGDVAVLYRFVFKSLVAIALAPVLNQRLFILVDVVSVLGDVAVVAMSRINRVRRRSRLCCNRKRQGGKQGSDKQIDFHDRFLIR